MKKLSILIVLGFVILLFPVYKAVAVDKPTIHLNLNHNPPPIEHNLGNYSPPGDTAKQQFLSDANDFMDNSLPSLEDVLAGIVGPGFTILDGPHLTKDDPADSYTEQLVNGKTLMETSPTIVRTSTSRYEDEDAIYIIDLKETYQFHLTGYQVPAATNPPTIPEPGTIYTVAAGILGLLGYGLSRKSAY